MCFSMQPCCVVNMMWSVFTYQTQGDIFLRHYDKGPCKYKLGHSRASVMWNRMQVRVWLKRYSLSLMHEIQEADAFIHRPTGQAHRIVSFAMSEYSSFHKVQMSQMVNVNCCTSEEHVMPDACSRDSTCIYVVTPISQDFFISYGT